MPCRCAERRQWIKTRIVDPATGKLVQVLKTIKEPTMSLTKRLAEIERRITAIEQWKAGVEASIEQEEAEDQPQPTLTLDGEQHGGERDSTQSLDG